MAAPDTAPEPALYGVLLTLAYDGAPFSGYVKQKNGRTVAGELEGAIATVDPKASTTRGVSRTDAGVHARGQLVAFDSTKDIDPRGWVLALNRELPREIAVVRAARTPVRFEPRRCVVSKTYVYRILESRTRDPLVDRFAWRIPYRLNQLHMREAAASIQGEHDFRAFRGSADAREETVRHIFRISLAPAAEDSRITELTVTGNKFLYNMIRIIAGTLVDIGRGFLPKEAVVRALASGLRKDLGITAPPEGLVLRTIELAEPARDEWPPPAEQAAESPDP
ncbi:MAG: tRNA pseudouridine(38-40) synthase TruA [Myxococcales bacterium]|nr:MAG: tRNA pseudouridine(38-40) synthase TruA [Myxococcales bacterium]